jgi:hypothetical protein
MAENKNSENIVQTSLQVASAILEKAPIYEDFAQPTTKALGAGLGGLLLYVMSPFIKMGMKAQQDIQSFEIDLVRKIEPIPPERLQAPNPMIAGPIIQALGYTVHEENIREMFTNLLATAMDSQEEHKAHPSFVEIIKQMTPDEAKIIKFFGESNNEDHPIIDIKAMADLNAYTHVARNQSFIPEDSGCKNIKLGSEYIDNLCRMGLTQIPDNVLISDHNQYSRLENWFSELEIVKADVNKFRMERKLVTVTDFGKLFISTCIKLI